MTRALFPKSAGGADAASPAASAHAFPDRMPALTSIRFWLALGVVLFHYQLNMVPQGGTGVALIERARLAVDFFFILSGFVLAHVYGRQVREGRYSHGRFLIARLARIYPAHFAMMMVMAAVASIAVLLGQPFDSDSYSLSGFGSAMLLTHAWFVAKAPNEWNGPSWSLSAEWAAYLAFPVFAWIGLKARRNAWVTLTLAVALFLGSDAFYRARFGEVLTHAELVLGVLRIAPEFLFGIGLYQVGCRFKPSETTARLIAAGALTALLVLMQSSADERLTVLVCGFVVLSLALLAKTDSDEWAAHPLALEAGEASYALYLVHLPLLIVWKNAMAMIRGGDSRYLLPWWEAGVLLAITLVAAFVLHRFWERPARLWVRRALPGVFLLGRRFSLPPIERSKMTSSLGRLLRSPWTFAVMVILFLFIEGAMTSAFAHGVAEGDKGYIQETSGFLFWPFVYLGAKHMVTGYDHLLFLFGVIFFLYRMKDISIYVTLFAIGHSSTLLLGVLTDISVSSYLVDAIIGLSVVYKALDNMGAFQRWFGLQPSTKGATLIFGLFHGFGLATKLQDFNLSPDGLIPNLIAFNIGVEIGQLLALGGILILMGFWRQSNSFWKHGYLTQVVLMTCGFILMGYQLVGFFVM